MHLPRQLARRSISAALSASLATISLATSIVPGPLAAAALPDAAPSSNIQLLAADTRACGQVRASDVATYVNDVFAARRQTAIERSRVPDLSTPGAIREFVRQTMPRVRPAGGTTHAMTSREYATYRAGMLVVDRGLSVNAAIRACGAQATLARLHAQPDTQSCGDPPCNVPITVEATYDTAGNYGNLYVSKITTKIVSQTSFNSSGSTLANGSAGTSTTSWWEPWGNGGKGGTVTFPSASIGTKTSTGTLTGALPVPSSVPQSGWVVLPGCNLWAYLTTDEIIVQLDNTGNDYYIVSETSSGGMQVYFHGISSSGQVYSETSPISYPAGSGGSAIARSGVRHPDGMISGFINPQMGSAAITIGLYLCSLPGFGSIGFVTVCAGVIIIWASHYDTTVVAATAWADDDGYLDAGGGGGGGGGGCDVSRPGNVPSLAPATRLPQDDSCDEDDW